MGLWAWLFPSDEDHLAAARALMDKGKHEKARERLMRCSLPEAEALYDECSAEVDKADRATLKKRMTAQGFRGWKVEVTTPNARRKKELDGLIAQEITKAGIDLSEPELDQEAVKKAIDRAQRKAARSAGTDTGTIRLVPILAAGKK
jgi:hypothetical protein